MAKSRRQLIRELAEELDIVDEMFDVLLEILEEKGLLNRDDFDRRLRERLNRLANLRSLREVAGEYEGKGD
ncbi:MAG: hypothetical protein B6U77_01655 [Candidatus Hecatellales archaeon ex4484_218]|nr:MAG: hypothetical protein B6U77_01655 [Candidatus Hecatellales archaeon ex4484_218]